MVRLLTEVLLRRLLARDDRLQEHRVLVFHERQQVHVVLAPDDEDALAGVTVGVRVFQDVEQVAALDMEDDFFEPDAALRPELRVLRVVPVEVLHRLQSSTMCAHKAHVGVGLSVPKSVPKRLPRTIIRQPTPTKRPKKNGPEIINFRPVLGSPLALANRRLQPLGHLTVRLQVYVIKTLTRTRSKAKGVKATHVQTGAFGVKCNSTSVLCRRLTTCSGTVTWAHSWAHTACFSLGLFRKRKEKATRRRFPGP